MFWTAPCPASVSYTHLIDHIDFDDKKVLESIGTGRTEGVFQLESAGMKSFMKELKAENLEDIIAGISLYRPGPMDFIPKYLNAQWCPHTRTEKTRHENPPRIRVNFRAWFIVYDAVI